VIDIQNEEEIEDGEKTELKPRKCPNCNSEMQEGDISSKDPIVWNENEEIKKGERIDKENLDKLAQGYDRIPSFKCESCKLIVVEYDKKKLPTIRW
jgi:transcription initiation factor IIE alpha subunit